MAKLWGKKTSFLLHQRLVNGASDVFSRLAGFLFLTCRNEQDHCLVNSLISERDNFLFRTVVVVLL